MSISIVSEPDPICLVRQPAPLVVHTNDYITTAGVKSHSFLEFTGDCTDGQTFQIVFNGKTIIFTCKTSPTTTLHFPVNTGSPLDDYAAEIITYLKRNDQLTEEIAVTLDGASNPALGKIKFEARYTGTIYNITLTESLSNCTQTGYQAGVNEVVRSGMKITLDLYAEDIADSFLFTLAAKTEADINSIGDAVFFLNRILHDYCDNRYYLPSVSLTGNDLTGLVKRYYTVLAEKYGSPPTLHNTYNSTHERKSYILGGFNYGKAIVNDFTADYITDADGKKFLTKRSNKRITCKTQREYLYCYVQASVGSMDISITAWDMDNVSFGAAAVYDTIDAPEEGIHCFAVGYSDLDVEALFGAPVYRYKVQITFASGSTETELIEFIVDRGHYYTNETFYYVNGFGCTETLWIKGTIFEKPVLDRQPAQRLRLYNDTADVGEYLEANPTHRKELEVNAGYLCSYDDSAWVADVLNTTNMWWYKSSQFLPMVVLDKEVGSYTSKQNVRELVIRCIEAYDNNTI